MTVTGPEDFPIGVPLPSTQSNWKLGEVVYTQYTYDENLPRGRRVIAKIRSYALPETDIRGFVEARRQGLPLPDEGNVRQWPGKDPELDRPINIYIGGPCWVVIELDSKINWSFEPNEPGITTKHDYSNNNCDLMHVLDHGTRADRLGPNDVGCRLIYFVVQRRPETMHHQQFHCHVVHENKRLEDPDMIDPDIPNDGGRFPFPLTSPNDSNENAT